MNLDTPMLQLANILAPQGIKIVTTGAGEVAQFVLDRYGSQEEAAVRKVWENILKEIPQAKWIILGVPMDAGAGFERGAFKGPLGIRSQFLSVPGFYTYLKERGIIDIGDVRVHPSLVSDRLLRRDTIRDIRKERYGNLGNELDLPVSPHSILERTLECLRLLNPQARVMLLGADHSISWIPIKVLTRGERNTEKNLGIVHFDAHTDLLRIRDGIEPSFATWAYHANDAIGRGGRLQQFGIRVSGRSREYWEETLGVRQFRMGEILARGAQAVIEETIQNFREIGVERVYTSNDIDGTDPRWAAATGTLEPDGMVPEFVDAMIKAIWANFEVIGGDLVEVAPPLKWHIPGEPARTLQMAAHYVMEQIRVTPNPFSIPPPAFREAVLGTPSYTQRF